MVSDHTLDEATYKDDRKYGLSRVVTQKDMTVSLFESGVMMAFIEYTFDSKRIKTFGMDFMLNKLDLT